MKQAQLKLDPDFAIGEVDRRLFGSFVEHMGRCVYTGIYEPGHPTADHEGFRGDVLDLVRELGVSVVRYPGGNFVSGYRWEDGTGPREDRPTRLDLAWRSIETNEVGVNEFATWARRAGVSPMMAVNLGTRGVREAADLVEYCNHPGGTYWSDLRVKHGQAEPHAISLWCLGNELDGPWQTGHKTAQEYGRLAAEAAKAMRQVDPGIELVACGSSNSAMPTFGAWEATVLEHTYDHVDYVSLHAYYEEFDGDLDSFLACAQDMDQFIGAVVATCDHVGAKLRRRKKIRLSFDEWNVWYARRFPGHEHLESQHAPRLIEDNYHVADAVVVGSLLITLLRHADRVSVACQAQLANVIAPILTEPGGGVCRQTIFYPFAQAARFARGTVLRVEPTSPRYDTARFGEVPLLSAVATQDGEEVTVFAVNRSTTESLGLTANLRAVPGHEVVEHLALAEADHRLTNTVAEPDRVRPRVLAGASVTGDVLTAELPALSWNVIRLRRRA
ncbi:alpha-N-arabinofuranosidase [Kutzneria viridogrisea]|uniref:non-reducing end alpha-L-arabinofuranosidase n=1 Tax=Kutzneria viridogrisea TaxID=47990 RepID=A0ABR6BF27_9PSEU|nr:alpha-N-arabinofuranosidase [Kutzneria viridogrisea]